MIVMKQEASERGRSAIVVKIVPRRFVDVHGASALVGGFVPPFRSIPSCRGPSTSGPYLASRAPREVL